MSEDFPTFEFRQSCARARSNGRWPRFSYPCHKLNCTVHEGRDPATAHCVYLNSVGRIRFECLEPLSRNLGISEVGFIQYNDARCIPNDLIDEWILLAAGTRASRNSMTTSTFGSNVVIRRLALAMWPGNH